MSSSRIAEFDTWQPGYGLAVVRVILANTDTDAALFTDEDLTLPAGNPVTLSERIVGGISYGKFTVPLYTGAPYQLVINTIDTTGIIRVPITTLDGEDASTGTVQVAGGTQDIELEDHLARRIDVRDFGDFIAVGGVGASASTNAATLAAALAAAATAGGGFVEAPGGTYAFTTLTIPAGAVLRGQGRAATTLQSTVAGSVVTVGGERAGLARLTLDGVTLVALSLGVYAENKNEVVLHDMELKRFETGALRSGGAGTIWHDLFISNCVTGAKIYGRTPLGGATRFNHWIGGKVELCTTAGIDLRYDTLSAQWNTFEKIQFSTNTGIAFKLVGARRTSLIDCRWSGNTTNLTVADATPANADNTVIGLDLIGGVMSDGAVTLSGTLKDVAFRRMELGPITLTLTTPGNNVLLQDCDVDSQFQIAGTPTALIRSRSMRRGSSTKTLDAAAPTAKAWAITLDPARGYYLEAKVVGRQTNGTNTGFYHIAVSAVGGGGTLAYDAQSANFTLGVVLTGATSGAKARIINDSDSGATGTLSLMDIVGTFLDNEIITDTGGGSATANGAVSFAAAALTGAVTALRAAQETNAAWNATFVANGPEIELRVTGDVSDTIEWTVDVDVVAAR